MTQTSPVGEDHGEMSPSGAGRQELAFCNESDLRRRFRGREPRPRFNNGFEAASLYFCDGGFRNYRGTPADPPGRGPPNAYLD
jgi:hypothetical protein